LQLLYVILVPGSSSLALVLTSRIKFHLNV
jgi:hypothetical protein